MICHLLLVIIVSRNFVMFSPFAGTGLAGMRQKDLIKWYIDQQNEKNTYSTMEEVKKEITKIKAIIEVIQPFESYELFPDFLISR